MNLENDLPHGVGHRNDLRVVVGGRDADIGGLHNRAIDAAIAYVNSRGGGVVDLTEGEFLITDVIHLRDNVTLRGQGARTILKKCDAVRSALAIDTDALERTVTLANAAGFEVGMGVTIGDDRHAFHGNEIVLTIAWKSGHTLGFAQPMKGLAMAARAGYAQTTFPVLYGAGIENVAVENLILEGNKANNFYVVNAWKDGAIYLDDVRGATVHNCVARNFNGFCVMVLGGADIQIADCQVYDNSWSEAATGRFSHWAGRGRRGGGRLRD